MATPQPQLRLYRATFTGKCNAEEAAIYGPAAVKKHFAAGTFYVESKEEDEQGRFTKFHGFIEADASMKFEDRSFKVFSYKDKGISLYPLDWQYGQYEDFYERKALESLTESLLGESLLPMDDDGMPGCFRTSNHSFYFILTDEPVMGGRTLAGQKPIPGRFKFSVQNPEEKEFAKTDSLGEAIEAAAHEMLNWKIRSMGESLFWQKHAKMEIYVQTEL